MRKQTKLVAVLSATALLAIGASMTSFAAQGWQEEGGTWVYYNKDGSLATSQWKKSGNNWYWLDSDGTMLTDSLVEEDDDYYYVDANGVMVTNQWVQLDNVDDADEDAPSNWWYYFQGNGKAYTANDSGTTSLKTINGKKYAFTDEGKMLFGWVDVNSTRQTDDSAWKSCDYYMGDEDDGAAAIGWAQIHVIDDDIYWDKKDEENEDQDYWFYFQSNGKKVKYDPSVTAAKASDPEHPMKTKTINGKKYGFDENGRMSFEWTQISSYNNTASVSTASAVANYSYFSDRDNGARVSKGWFKTVPDEDISYNDSQDDEERWYYAYSVGKICHSEFKTINGKRYVFDNSGRMLDGLQAIYTDSYGQIWNRKLDDEDLVKDGTELKNGGSTTLRLIDAAGLEQNGTVPGYGWSGKSGDETVTVADAISYVALSNTTTGKIDGDNFGGKKKPTFGVFYCGDGNDGAIRTSTQTINIEGESYTFYFKKDGDRKGEGVNGKKDNYLYQNGKRVKADKDNKYEAYIFMPSEDSQGYKDIVDNVADYLEYEAAGETLIGGNIYRVQSNETAIKGVMDALKKKKSGDDDTIYLVNTSGSITKGTKSSAKDGNDMYFIVEKGSVVDYRESTKRAVE